MNERPAMSAENVPAVARGEPQKHCPRCGTPHALAAAACGQCGRRFRTTFPSPDATLKMPAALLPAAPVPQAPAVRPGPPPEALEAPPAPKDRLHLARPQALAPPAVSPPEVRHRAALDELSRQFLGLARFYALAVLTAPTLLIPLAVVSALRAAEAGTCAEVAALGVDAGAWAAPLRRARVGRIVRAAAVGLLLAGLFVVAVLALHKAINVLDSKMDPIIPDSDGTGAPSSNSSN